VDMSVCGHNGRVVVVCCYRSRLRKNKLETIANTYHKSPSESTEKNAYSWEVRRWLRVGAVDDVDRPNLNREWR